MIDEGAEYYQVTCSKTGQPSQFRASVVCMSAPKQRNLTTRGPGDRRGPAEGSRTLRVDADKFSCYTSAPYVSLTDGVHKRSLKTAYPGCRRGPQTLDADKQAWYGGVDCSLVNTLYRHRRNRHEIDVLALHTHDQRVRFWSGGGSTEAIASCFHLSDMVPKRLTSRTPWKASFPHNTKAFSAMPRSSASSACSARSFHSLQKTWMHIYTPQT